MAMGTRRRQDALFVIADGLPRSPRHPFHRKLNELLAEAEFDRSIEGRCERYYATDEKRDQPSIPPGASFRMRLAGYFEGIDSQRGIAWRCADSLSLRQFLSVALDQKTPDHSTQHPQSAAAGSVCRVIYSSCSGRQEAAGRQDRGRRPHATGGRRGHEEHRAARHGRGLE